MEWCNIRYRQKKNDILEFSFTPVWLAFRRFLSAIYRGCIRRPKEGEPSNSGEEKKKRKKKLRLDLYKRVSLTIVTLSLLVSRCNVNLASGSSLWMCHVACPPSNPWNGWIVTADNRWIYERHGRLHSALSANEIYGGRFCTVSPLWLAQTRLILRSVDSVLPICGYLHARNFRRVLKCPVLNRFQKFPPREFSAKLPTI